MPASETPAVTVAARLHPLLAPRSTSFARPAGRLPQLTAAAQNTRKATEQAKTIPPFTMLRLKRNAPMAR